MNKTLVKGAFFLLLAVYLADCFSPLRLHVDTVRYYAIKDCIEFGCPVTSDAATDYFPYGYTVLLLLFSKLGILKHFPIIFINVVYLIGGLYFLYKTFQSKLSPYALFVVVMLNWLFVKFTDHPLSELQYIFFSLGSVYFYSCFSVDRKVKYLLLALVMGWIAFMTRTIGITLIGALALDLLWKYKEQQLEFFRRHRVLVSGILVVLVVLIVVFSKVVGINHYGDVLREHFKEAPFFKRVGWRFKEWGEIFINTPSNKVIDRLAGWPGEVLFMGIGLAIFVWFMVVLFSRKYAFPLYLKLYLVFYCLLLFNWPFNDPRFWLPVMPLMAAVVLQAALPRTSWARWGKAAYVTMYAALGLFSAGYMVYSSFNRDFLSRNQAKGAYKNEYETHWYGKPLSDTARKMDTLALQVLDKYD
ncbi:MAG TPA: hypothetical protein VNU70_13830 [Puia sp.]|jgi:hypothetical protein|nr:hypothetical protein [Puia sp.]